MTSVIHNLFLHSGWAGLERRLNHTLGGVKHIIINTYARACLRHAAVAARGNPAIAAGPERADAHVGEVTDVEDQGAARTQQDSKKGADRQVNWPHHRDLETTRTIIAG